MGSERHQQSPNPLPQFSGHRLVFSISSCNGNRRARCTFFINIFKVCHVMQELFIPKAYICICVVLFEVKQKHGASMDPKTSLRPIRPGWKITLSYKQNNNNNNCRHQNIRNTLPTQLWLVIAKIYTFPIYYTCVKATIFQTHIFTYIYIHFTYSKYIHRVVRLDCSLFDCEVLFA